MVSALELAYKVYEELKRNNQITEDLRKKMDSIPSIVLSSGIFGLTLLALKNMDDKDWNSIEQIVIPRFLSEKTNREIKTELKPSELIKTVYEMTKEGSFAIITREFLEYIKWLKYLIRAHTKGEG